MLVVRDLSRSPWPGRRAVVTIGAYDGVHLGHQSVISAVRAKAAADGAVSVVVTFDRHPASVVRPESAPLLLTDLDQKLELLEATGVDAVVVVPFDREQASEEPHEFVQRVLVDCLAVSHVAVGEDFHFGRNRAGDVTMLREHGAKNDFTVGPLELLQRDDGVDEPVSSTAIRRALKGGDVAVASRMLGRWFEARVTRRQRRPPRSHDRFRNRQRSGARVHLSSGRRRVCGRVHQARRLALGLCRQPRSSTHVLRAQRLDRCSRRT